MRSPRDLLRRLGKAVPPPSDLPQGPPMPDTRTLLAQMFTALDVQEETCGRPFCGDDPDDEVRAARLASCAAQREKLLALRAELGDDAPPPPPPLTRKP